MASRPVMVLGNLASIALAIAGILQALSWTIAGATILAILSITTLAPTKRGSPTGTGHSAVKKAGHVTATETKPSRDKGQEKQGVKPSKSLIAVKDGAPNVPSSTRTDLQKALAPKITPPKVVAASFSPGKPGSVRPGSQKQEAIRPIPVGPSTTTVGIVKPQQPKLDPNTRTIAMGDLATYDVELSQRAEVTCEVSATAPVNVYLMDEANLNSLELGEEFWSETGEETVQNATLHFVAPQAGKWILVVENADNDEVSAKVNIRKGPLSKTKPAT